MRFFLSLVTLLLCFYFLGVSLLQELTLNRNKHAFIDDAYKDNLTVSKLVDELYPTLTLEEWQLLQNEINASSNVPIEVKQLSYFSLPKQAKIQLSDKGFYVEDVREGIVYYQLAHQNHIAKVGPLITTENASVAAEKYELFLIASLVLLLLVWSIFQQLKINKLAQSCEHFSNGDFTHRTYDGWFSIPTVSKSFNLMAAKIEQLFNKQKQLINSVSHELRSPVNRLKFRLEALRERDDNDFVNQSAMLLEDLDELEQMVGELLLYSRLTSTQQPCHFTQKDISSWMHSQINKLNVEFNGRVERVTDTNPQQVTFDEKLFSRLLRNLVENACFYGTSTVRVEYQFIEQNHYLWVIDNASYIEPLEFKKYLEPFARPDDSRTRATGGTGLGLAIVNQIICWHKGEVLIQRIDAEYKKIGVKWPKFRCE